MSRSKDSSESVDPFFYAPGYSPARKRFETLRRAEDYATFLLPYVKDTSKILDCGCGLGSITRDLAALAPQGFTLGIDQKGDQVSYARHLAREENLKNVFFEKQDASKLEFADNTFDIVFSHAMLLYLEPPTQAVREMVRVCRPGGIIALRSPEWLKFQFEPSSPVSKQCLTRFMRRLEKYHGDCPDWKDFVLFLKDGLGFDEPQVSFTVNKHQGSGLIALAEIVCETLLQDENEADDQLAEVTKGFMEWANREEALLSEEWNEIIARKPLDHA